ncbi:F-box only protein 47-like [Chanos chanos]|uniref:F-box only protein 47-like n=1 Tax=Chanos chanos TaxID=29144 RepID=A0A6J2WAT1_CHACN|nr:F-box only protein 47 [Chanos chanos]
MAATRRKYTSTHTYRLRCSRRRPYTCRTLTTSSQSEPADGFFEKLPVEVFDLILDDLSVVEISVLSMVSKSICNYIVGHVSTLSWRERMIFQKFHNCTSPTDEVSVMGHSRSLGLLFKRCTLLLPTKDRLRFIYNRFSQVPCFTMEQCSLSAGCLGFSCYGVFLQTLIAGWDELECHRVFNFLCEFTNLPRKIEAVVTSKPGACHKLELQIRLFCRGVLLDPWQGRQDALFWLTRILKPWPMVSQARLLFILYGPLHPDGKVGWQSVCEGVLPPCGLWDLAKAIILLHGDQDARDWSTDTVLAIFSEMTVVPQLWHMENLARLLVLCGNAICYSVLASKAINGRIFEISRLLVYLILVCEKDGYCMNWSVKMTEQVCRVFPSASEKWSFIQSVENTLSDVTMEMCELMAGNRNDLDTFQSLCTLLNASAHFHTEIVYMFLKDN